MNLWILDIETTKNLKHIHCVCVREASTQEVQVFTNRFKFHYWLNEGNKVLVGHNIIGFDKERLETLWGTYFKQKFIDTLILSRLDNPVREGGHSLANWGEIIGDPKSDFDDYDNYSQEMVDYCIQDTKVTFKVFKELEYLLEGQERAVKIEHDLQLALTRMKSHGFLLNVDAVNELKLDLEAELWQIEESLCEVFPDKVEIVTMKTKTKIVRTRFNPGSRKQVADRLIELGWEPITFTEPTKTHPKGQPIVDELVLKDVDIPEARVISRFFLLQKRISQLAQWLEYVDEDNRVRCSIMGIGAITHRAAHMSPNLGQVVNTGSEYGKEFRQCWTVEPGNVLVGADLKSLEGRVMCHYTQDTEYAKAVCFGSSSAGTDIHTVNMRAFGITSRDDAKTCYYALMYGAGAKKIAQVLGCSVDVAREKINNFYDNLPLLKELKEKVDRLSKKGYLTGLDGRKVQVRSAHAALNTLFQSGGAIISKVWLNITRKLLDDAGLSYVGMVVWVHDEIQLECKEEDAEQVMEITKSAALLAGTQLDLRVPIEADAKVGNNWYETH